MKSLSVVTTLILVAGILCPPLFAATREQTFTVLDMSGDWEAEGDLPWQALLLSVQGHANKTGPGVFLVYPENFKHPNVKAILDYYKQRHSFKTDDIRTVEQAVHKYSDYFDGYVIWDKEVLPTLMMAFTVSGLENALVVCEDYIDLAEATGLKRIEDFRMRFRNKPDVEIFRWAYDQYFERCNKDILVYLGEWCTGLNRKPGMRPAIADFGIVHQAFFTDLSASPADRQEYQLADRIMSEMNDYAYVFGWHSYCKDQEPEHLTMVSRNALVIAEGLATLPNMSFHRQVPVSNDFSFEQKSTYDKNPSVEDKVYITLIQSDGLGIGSWLRPGRGKIPYGWETNMEWIDFAPALLQYYYESATANDYFIGSLSGPGYFYPKAYPIEKLPGALKMADSLMRRLDLHVFGIMDFSQGDRKVGNVDLTEEVVDAYYENMTYTLGFINGYGPGNTYDFRNGRPMISYNYYVDIEKTAKEVAEDFKELGRINPDRPYFIPVHVRENNDVERMGTILDLLSDEFVIIPPEEFMLLAAKKPTMTSRYLDDHPDFSGHWRLDRAASKNIMPTTFELDIDHRGNVMTITTTAWYHRYIHHRKLQTTKTLIIGGKAVKSPEERPRRMGYLAAWTDSISTRARYNQERTALILTTNLKAQTQQGSYPMTSVSEYTLSDGGMTLTVTEWRKTRESNKPVTVFVYRKELERFDH
ncbi:hypothetical protein GF407_10895 [candidate division KSB1 bacterium]|nr:hypothetical protein [candidate division KSB1 bacterium]